MNPHQPGNETRSSISARVPTNHKDALIYLADAESTAHDRVSLSEVLRDFVSEGLVRRWDELPEEAKDVLDDDLKADAGENADPSEAVADGGKSA